MEIGDFIGSKVRNLIWEVQILRIGRGENRYRIDKLDIIFLTMANTFTQIHLQVVLAVKNRKGLISSDWESRLYEYMVAIIQNHGHKVLAINGMPDHVHIMIGLRPNQSLSELMQKLKASSSKWINEEKLTNSKFAWQEGYGAFSYTKSDVPKVVNYILQQKEHHRKSNFLVEYRRILDRLNVEYNPIYIFKEPE